MLQKFLNDFAVLISYSLVIFPLTLHISHTLSAAGNVAIENLPLLETSPMVSSFSFHQKLVMLTVNNSVAVRPHEHENS